MSSKTDKPTDQIQGLLDERLKIMEWLDRLGAADVATPSKVKERVRLDYETRLDAVSQELKGFTDELEEALSKQKSSRDGLKSSEDDAETRLAEAQLRHSVGEFEDGKFDELQEGISSELQAIRSDLGACESEIERLDDVLSLVRGKPKKTGKPPRSNRPQSERSRARRPDPEPSEPEAAQEPKAEPLVVHGPRPIRPGAASVASPGGEDDDLAFLKSVSEDVGEGSGRAAKSASETTATAARQDSEAGPKKTLKCEECGVMNFPTEWYCERCGAELAAL